MGKVSVSTIQTENQPATIPKEVVRLVEQFREHREAYQSGQYNEAQLRQEFINPLFEALGWDVNNKQGHAEAYKDVIHEDSIKIGGATKAPDYCFRIGGLRKFFVEAKKPSVNLKEDISPAYQLRRYAWSAKLPLGILTDFEEFAVYDCRTRPVKTDGPAVARVLYFTYENYAEHCQEITSIFSREAVLKGSFDKYAESTKAKRGTAEVDSVFLKEIESWREELAQNLALRNPKLSQRELNFAVQRTIDRIIFLRICEDRGVEPYGRLLALTNGAQIYPRLSELFHRADERYNSGLFYFHKEKDRFEPPDELTLKLVIDDKLLKEMITHLYYPDSPYEFSVLPADILGQVYEQFLGKVIRLTPGHRAVVEDKPEVKKAGGVYYTPTYIVDYIVKNTVGKLLEGKKPKQIAKFKILDPACGSGSFLIGVYQYLLDWHRDWYVADGPANWTKGRSPVLYQAGGGDWRLTTAERRRILLNSIYGVDIDPQAVEVTKLSLLLKVLEGENEQTLAKQFELFHERALPDLASNIKCGNSLIGPDFYDGQQLSLIDDEERMRINAFDWKKEFPFLKSPPPQRERGSDEVGAKGVNGFDVVIGNPPYSAKQSLEHQKLTSYFHAVEYKCDPFAFFIEQGLNQLKRGGRLGFIVPVSWMTNFYYMKLRRLFIETNSLSKVALIDGLVFENANVDTCLLFLHKEFVQKRQFEWSKTTPENVGLRSVQRSYDQLDPNERFELSPAYDEKWLRIRRKVESISVRLDTITKISLGMKLRSNSEFVVAERDKGHPDVIYFGDNISRYGTLVPNRFFNFKDAVIVGGTKNPAVQMAKPKILVQAIRNLSLKRRIVAALDRDGKYFVGTVNAIIPLGEESNILYTLGILNSTLANTYFSKRFTTISLTSSFLGAIPAKAINFSHPADKSRHDKMVALVEQMLELHKQLAAAKTDHEKTALQRQIETTDKQIDQLVYELYGLTDDEIKIVEEETNKKEAVKNES